MRLLKKIISSFLVFIIVFSIFLTNTAHSDASILTQAQIQMSDSRPGQTAVTYTNTFMVNAGASGNVKCIVVQFAANSDMTGGAPTGMTTTSAVKGSATGTTWTNGNITLYDGINNAVTNGYLQFEDSASEALTGNTWATASATTITNPTASTYYAQISTYSTLPSSHTCAGTQISSNVMAISTTAGVATSVTVPPSITFSVAGYNAAVNGSGDTVNTIATGTSIAFGAVPGGTASSAAQLLTVSTNAANGYTLYVDDTGTMKDSNLDTFRDQAGTPQAANSFDGSTSQSSFAYTADGAAVAFGSNKWAGLGNSSTQYLIALRSSSINADPTHVEYKVEPSNTQPPGTYSTTIVYTAVPSY